MRVELRNTYGRFTSYCNATDFMTEKKGFQVFRVCFDISIRSEVSVKKLF